MIGKRERRTVCAVAMALLATAFAFPALAAADGAEEGAVIESLAPSHQWPWAHWTRQRLEEAEPMPIVTLPGPVSSGTTESSAANEGSPTMQPAATESAAAAESSSPTQSDLVRTAAAGATTAGVAGPSEGVEVGPVESTLFPNSANGKLFGTYEIRVGAHEYRQEDYVCSGSVVNSGKIVTSDGQIVTPPGNIIVTAGHCLIEPETGTRTNEELIFIPGYRNGTAPYGIWHAEFFTTTETWKKTAKFGSTPNEGGDLAFVTLRSNEGQTLEKAVGSLGLAFDQACNQTYTQFGYPAESPYSGELLYSHTAGYAGADTTSQFSPVPMKIASDFTRGASGGPWATGVGGGGVPTVLSLTAYGYASQPGYLYGPYFGEAAKKAYGSAFLPKEKYLAAGIEEACKAPPPVPTPPQQTPPATTPPPEATPPAPPVTLKVTRVRRRANGSAVLTAKVNTAGMLKLSGTAVRAESLDTPTAGKYRMVVAAKGATTVKLRQVGRAKVGVKIAFSASGKTKRVSRKIQLSRRSAQQQAPQSRR